jgi:hypothetical protein
MQSLMNEIGYWPIYLLMTYFVLIFNAGWALRISGMKWSTLCGTLRHVQWVRAARTESPVSGVHNSTCDLTGELRRHRHNIRRQ